MAYSQQSPSFSYEHASWEWVSWILSIAKDFFFSVLFLFLSTGFVVLTGNQFSVYLLTGLFFVLLICRRSVPQASFFSKEHRLFCIPSILFIMPNLLSSLDFAKPFYETYADFFDLIACLFLIGIARAPLYYARQSGLKVCRLSYKNMLLFFLLQLFYGGLVFYGGFYQIEKRPFLYELLTPAYFKKYSNNSGIHFYYEREEMADRIASVFPDVMQTLKTSPLYSEDIYFVLVERKSYPFRNYIFYYDEKIENSGGLHDPFTGICTYPALSDISSDREKYFDVNIDYRVITHEFTHRMINAYFDKIYGFPTYNFFLPLWKNEGYAEYMATKGYYTKSDWLDILSDNNISDQLLDKPFHKAHTVQDYIAACIQTRYALDYKGISVFDFMQSSYKPASAQEIKMWLKS